MPPKTHHSTKNKPALIVLSLVMLINALSYGIIIPLMYTYAHRFGITPVGLSLLLVSFSLAQFISTPIIGRLSDRYGRKIPLLLCLLGSSVAMSLFALATNAAWLFASRIVDGITGGNVAIAQAVITDITDGKERTKAFGILGAAFGFGFLVGPALGGVLGNVNVSLPFWFAAGLALVGVILGWWLLPETLSNEHRQLNHLRHREPLFRPLHLLKALFSPTIGLVLVIGLLGTTAQNAWIIGFQSFTVDQLHLNTSHIGFLFTLVGVVSVIMQGGGIRWLINVVKSKKVILTGSLFLSTIIALTFLISHQYLSFLILIIAYSIVLSPQAVMITGLLSERTKAEDQGTVLGINQSYNSVGQILGPLLASLVIGQSIYAVFLLGAVLLGVGTLTSVGLYHRSQRVDL
jgi:multidrug resistance protein